MPQFRFEHAQDVDTVFNLITSPDELTARCEALGERNAKAEASESGGVTNTQIAREVDQELPGFAKRLFKPTNTLVEREQWRSVDGGYEAKGQLKIVGTGATIDSTIRLSPQRLRMRVRDRLAGDGEGAAHSQKARIVHRRHGAREPSQPARALCPEAWGVGVGGTVSSPGALKTQGKEQAARPPRMRFAVGCVARARARWDNTEGYDSTNQGMALRTLQTTRLPCRTRGTCHPRASSRIQIRNVHRLPR